MVCTHSIDFSEHFLQNVLLLKEVENQDINLLLKIILNLNIAIEHLKEQIIKLIGGSDEK